MGWFALCVVLAATLTACITAERPPPAVAVKTHDTNGLTVEQITWHFKSADLWACWGDDPSQDSKVVAIDVVITADGSVAMANAYASSFDRPEVGRCVEGRVLRMRLPQAKADTRARLRLVFPAANE